MRILEFKPAEGNYYKEFKVRELDKDPGYVVKNYLRTITKEEYPSYILESKNDLTKFDLNNEQDFNDALEAVVYDIVGLGYDFEHPEIDTYEVVFENNGLYYVVSVKVDIKLDYSTDEDKNACEIVLRFIKDGKK